MIFEKLDEKYIEDVVLNGVIKYGYAKILFHVLTRECT